MILTERIPQVASVEMPGGVWTAKEFVFFEGATTDQLCASVVRLNKLNLSSKWALGDLGIALQDRKRIEVRAQVDALTAQAEAIDTTELEAKDRKHRLLKEANKLNASRVDQYTGELAEKLGVDPGHWRNCVMLARFYAPSLRNDALFPEHHLIAMRAARAEKDGASSKRRGAQKNNGVAQAQGWLSQAAGESLTASELRRRVNMAAATHAPATGKPEPNPYALLAAADTWAIGYRETVATLSPGQCAALLTMGQGLWELHDALRARIAAA